MPTRVAFVAALLLALALIPASAQVIRPGPPMGGPPNGPQANNWPETDNVVSVNGTVSDLDGRPIINAQVELRSVTSAPTRVGATTDAAGRFEFENVPAGRYEVSAWSGAAESTRQEVDVQFHHASMTLSLPIHTQATDGSSTVSLAQMKVPGKAQSELQKAEEQLARNKLEEAHKHVLRAIEIYPDYAKAYMIMGILDLQDQKAQEAAQDLEKSIKLDPNAPMTYIVLAATYNSMGRYDDALRAVGSSNRMAPTSWQGAFESSKSYLGKGDYQSALKEVERAQKLSPKDYAPARLVKANALLGLQQYQLAVDEMEAYLSADPQSPDAARVRTALSQAKAFTAGKK